MKRIFAGKAKVLLLVFALVLASCGSDAEDEAVDTAAESTEAEATTEDSTATEEAAETTETTETTEAPAEDDGPTSLIISTASTGGTYYPVGVALSTLTNVNLANSGIQMNAISSAGSGENVQLLKNREVDLAILQGLFGAMAWQGKGIYEGTPEQTMRSVSMLWENVEHISVASDLATTGNISDLDNLAGEGFSIGRRGSGTETSGTVILEALGYDVDNDFAPERVGYSESAAAMQDGRIKGMNTPAGPPVSAVTQAFATMGGDITLLEFDDAQLEAINTDFPVWSRYVIPAGTYPGVDVDVNTIAQPNFLAVHPDLTDETVYELTKNIYENLDFLVNIHQATGAMSLERAIVGLPVPLHPGAIQYYEEVGLEIPEELKAP